MSAATGTVLRRGRPGRAAAAAVVLVLLAAVGACEALGWPFLVQPMQRWLGDALQRPVRVGADPASDPRVVVHLLGGIVIRAASIEIGAPPWSASGAMLQARDAVLALGYLDLWRASRGAPLRIRELRAGHLDGTLERLADGRASWQFGRRTETPDTEETPSRVPLFGRLQVDAGSLRLRDALAHVQVDATYSLVDATNISAAGVQPAGSASGLVFDATGDYRGQSLRIALRTAGVLPVIADDAQALALPVELDARVGGASLTFAGTTTDALHLGALQGRFTVQGPSLAAIGRPLGLTLPQTPRFRATGLVVKAGSDWKAVVDSASIGGSRLAGAFTFTPRGIRPLLAGRLGGARLALADLGPAVGAAAAASGAAGRPEGRILPDRPFDLPALRAMDANILVAIDKLDLGTDLLAPLEPLHTHLVLADGLLTLREFEAHSADGVLAGALQLDGRGAEALWRADLRWREVRLERWIRQRRSAGAPPYVTGRLDGELRVAGHGRSTAAILGSLDGAARMHVGDGAISHVAIEAAGLDLAQALGVMARGDDALPLQCNVIDLVAVAGRLSPRAFVLDTRDSTIVVDGSVSLSSERIDLRLVTSPKDISPLALRTPIEVRGSFAAPALRLTRAPLVRKLGEAGLLALLNPLAALVPLVDLGDRATAERDRATCRTLSQRLGSAPGLPPPRPAATGKGG